MKAKDTGLNHTGKFVLHGYEERHGYQGGVWIDVVGGVSGTAYPIGTASNPVNNISQARTIADNYGYRTFNVRGQVTLNTGYVDWQFLGWGQTANDRIGLNYKCIDGSYFERVTVSGCCLCGDEWDGSSCLIKESDLLLGTFSDCLFEGNISLDSGVTTALNCAFKAGTVLDFGITGAEAYFNACSGDVTVSNMTSSLNKLINSFISGEITIDNTCTDGEVHIHGVVHVTDDSGAGCTVDRDAQLPYATFQSDLAEYTTEGTAGHSILYTAYSGEVWLDARGKYEISRVLAAAANSIPQSSYFTMQGITAGVTTDYYVWFNRSGGGSDPNPGGTGIEIATTTGWTNTQVATQMIAVIDAETEFGAAVGSQAYSCVITNASHGQVEDTADFNTNLNFNINQQGEDHGGYSGTTFPVGTPFKPVDNLTDALAISSDIGTVRFACIGDIVLDQDVNTYMFRSQADAYTSASVDVNGYDATGCHFSWMLIQGDCSGSGQFTAENSWMVSLTDVACLFRDCQIDGSFVIKSGGQFKGVGVAAPNIFGTNINMNASASQIGLVDVNGVLNISNSGAGGQLAIAGVYKLSLSAVCTPSNGIAILYVVGNGEVNYPGDFDGSLAMFFVDATLPATVWDVVSSEHDTLGTFGSTFALILNYLVATLNPAITTIDANVDLILEDTGTTLPATLAAILEDTGTTIPASLASIIVKIDNIFTDVATLLSLNRENVAIENTFDSQHKHTGFVMYCYDSAANATTNDHVTGFLKSYELSVGYDANSDPELIKMVLMP